MAKISNFRREVSLTIVKARPRELCFLERVLSHALGFEVKELSNADLLSFPKSQEISQ